MSNNSISQYYKKITLEKWRNFGYQPVLYEAVTPETMDLYKDLEFDKKQALSTKYKPTPFSPTEKAVWYSHYFLWKICAEKNIPIIITEHDVYPFKELPLEEFKKHDAIRLCRTWSKKHGHHICLPCGCYYLTPITAKYLIKRTKKDPIRINVDGMVKPFSHTDVSIWSTEDIVDKKVGTTIVHYKKSVV